MKRILSAVLSAASASLLMAELPTPKAPAKPTPYFSWDTVPVAFHGANKARLYTQEEVEQLASRYQMVTLEKWYTKCGSQGPDQAGPGCHVEAKMATTFKAIKAANPNVTTMLYLNSMFNFAFYHLVRARARARARAPCMCACMRYVCSVRLVCRTC